MGKLEDLEVGLGGYNASRTHDLPEDYDEVSMDNSTFGRSAHVEDSDCEAEVEKKEYRNDRRKTARDDRLQAEPPNVLPIATLTSSGFGIGLDELVPLVRDRSLEALNQYNGVQGLSTLLKTDLKKGIDGCDDDLLQRRQTFGSNTYLFKKEISFWSLLWTATTKSPLSLLMVLAAVIYLLLRVVIYEGCCEEAFISLLIVVVIIGNAIIKKWHSGLFEKLTEEKRKVHLEVIRGGRRVRVSIYDIVVGDIVPLKNGGQVPADGVLFEANSLKIDEQEITGSHEIVQKDLQKDPFLLSGSKLIEGIGTMMVTSVGMNTKWGQKMEIHHETDEEKPFHVNLKWIADSASSFVVLFALGGFLVQICKYFCGQTKKLDGNPRFIRGRTTFDDKLECVIKFLRFGIATIIVALPVGLSTAIPLNRANTARKMMTDNALVQTLSACERMGYVTTIVCHKTGILTLNKMSVANVWAGGMSMQDMDNGFQLPVSLRELIIEGIAQNTNGSVVLEKGNSEPEIYGSATEQAILSFGNKLGMVFDDTRSASSVHHTIPFNPKKKYGGVALQIGEEARVHWKGSAKTILSSCEEYMDGANNVRSIDEHMRKYFEGIIENMCMRGMRCATLAYQPCELESLPTIKEPQNLVLLAIISIKDPCRPGTSDAIQVCKSGDVKVCMVTEDDVLTATAIAKKCGIFGDASDCNIMTGPEFRNLSNLERQQRARGLLVLAQSCPSDHLLFVKALKGIGDVVAATGMGIHDPETLLEADVSLAMGIGGTTAVKENSDIIILDDDFATIVKVIRWSRYLYTSIQRYVLFRLTVSVSVVAICVVEVVIYDAFPHNAVQFFLLNLIIDTFGALALAYRPPEHQLMGKPPVGIRDPLITKVMWFKLVLQVIYHLLLLALVNSDDILKLKHGHTANAEKVMNTLIFNSFVFCLAFNEFEIRSLDQTFKEILRDNMFVVTITSSIILQIIVIKFLGIFIPSIKLDLEKWLLSSLLGLLSQLATRFPLQVHQYDRN